ncbi:hypothetical protein [Winogradskya humida]|uniref:Uncharacterized protein n=1 Tax=Winogradskya humida TaxID=113566 RepID=A0ABQ3ZSQ1_9ACTN|nr:hypothetical protein [Actinoplanes humidus]GIE21610.1 hypothetical protein Ahu01nite_047120 [Actinoplanes humidus]
MDEAEFWGRLEFRVCAEFRGFEDNGLRYLWCDGFEAEDYHLEGADPFIGGVMWCGVTGQERWRFTLFVGGGVRSREGIDWAGLLPDDEATGWLNAEPREMTVVLRPLEAGNDPAVDFGGSVRHRGGRQSSGGEGEEP